jgi:hypothetical protein
MTGSIYPAAIRFATHRKIHVIAAEIFDNWKGDAGAAAPYLAAMRFLAVPSDRYGLDDGKGIVLRFLANAEGWRGETARRIKKELKAMVAS